MDIWRQWYEHTKAISYPPNSPVSLVADFHLGGRAISKSSTQKCTETRRMSVCARFVGLIKQNKTARLMENRVIELEPLHQTIIRLRFLDGFSASTGSFFMQIPLRRYNDNLYKACGIIKVKMGIRTHNRR